MGAEGFQNALGYGVGTLAAMESLRSPGGLGRFLTGQIAARENPNVRAGLVGSPFSAGFLGVSGSRQPVGPLQPVDLGPGGPSAPERAPSMVWAPNLPPLTPEEMAKQSLAGVEAEAIQGATPQERGLIGRVGLGLPIPPGPAPAGFETTKIGPSGATYERVPSEPVPAGYSKYGQKIVRTQALPKAPGEGGGVAKKPFDLWAREHPTGTYNEWREAEAAQTAARAGQLAKVKEQYAKLPVAAQNTVATVDTMDNVVDRVRALLADPEVRSNRGVFEGRLRNELYLLGVSASPDEDAYLALSNFSKIMGAQPFMRGTRNMQYIAQIQDHLPKPGDQADLIDGKLNQMQFYLDSIRENIINVATTPAQQLRRRPGERPPGGPGGGPGPSAGGAPEPGQEIIPGVIYNGPAQ